MKKNACLSAFGLIFLTIFALNAPLAEAADLESWEFNDTLLSLKGPGAPVFFEDAVIFTAASNHRRVGAAFGHEGFSRVHWFRKLLIPQDPLGAPIPAGKKKPDPYKDSGILFYALELPKDLKELDYRLSIDGLWTVDPANPLTRRDEAGLSYSFLTLPKKNVTPYPLDGPKGCLSFSFKGPPGQTVTVAGSFNGWDPFMYELKEDSEGMYSLVLPLPAGSYQYVFYHNGERMLDPYNFRRTYNGEGKAVSEIVIE